MDSRETIQLLQEIRANQQAMLELGQRQLELVEQQCQRSIALQERAEAIQEKSARLVETGRRTMAVVLPIIALLILSLLTLLVF